MFAIAATLAACSPAPEASSPPPLFFATTEEAYAGAEDTYRAYMAALDTLDLSKPETFESAFSFTSGSLNAIDREFLAEMHAEGNSKVGETAVVTFEGTSFTESPNIEIAAVACIDQSTVDLLGPDRVSIVSPDRPDYYTMELTFEVVDERLVISNSQPVGDQPCDS